MCIPTCTVNVNKYKINIFKSEIIAFFSDYVVNIAFSNDFNPQYNCHRYPKQSYVLFLDESTKKNLLRFVP